MKNESIDQWANFNNGLKTIDFESQICQYKQSLEALRKKLWSLIPQPLSFPECLLSFFLYKKSLFYRNGNLKPIKIESSYSLAALFNITYLPEFSEIFESLNNFFCVSKELRSSYEVDAYKTQILEFNTIPAYPEKLPSDKQLRTKLNTIPDPIDLLGEYYIQNGIPPFLYDFVEKCRNVNNNVIIIQGKHTIILTPDHLKVLLRNNGTDKVTSETLITLYKFTQTMCLKSLLVSNKTFNISKYNHFFTISVTKNQVICKMATEVPLAPSIIWENVKFLQRDEADPLSKLLLNETSFFHDFCAFINTIRQNKYDRRFFIFKVSDNSREKFHDLMGILPFFVQLIDKTAFTSELLWKLTICTLNDNNVLIFDPKKPVGDAFIQKLRSLICGDTIKYQVSSGLWPHFYKNSSTICLIDNGNIDLEFLNTLCTRCKGSATILEFTDDILDELLNVLLPTGKSDSLEFFLLLCSFYEVKAKKIDVKPLVGKEVGFVNFINCCCCLDEIKDSTSGSWIYAQDLYVAYQTFVNDQKGCYKPIEFKNKLFEMNYADPKFHDKRHTKTQEGKDRNGRIYYGIQLRPAEDCVKTSKAEVDVSPTDECDLSAESIYNFYKDLFLKITESLQTK